MNNHFFKSKMDQLPSISQSRQRRTFYEEEPSEQSTGMLGLEDVALMILVVTST